MDAQQTIMDLETKLEWTQGMLKREVAHSLKLQKKMDSMAELITQARFTLKEVVILNDENN